MPILAFWVVLMTATPTHPVLMTNEKQVSPGITVKLGAASLEEYRHGDPASRVFTTRS